MTSKSKKDMVSVYIPAKRPEWEIEGMDLSLAAIIGVFLAAMAVPEHVKGKAPQSFGEDEDLAVETSEKASLQMQ